MVNYKDWNLKTLGHYIVLGIVILAIIMMFVMIVVPLLGHVSAIFAGFTLTDTILFLILLRLVAE